MTKSKGSSAEAEKAAVKKGKRAVIFEMTPLLAGGRKAAYDLIRSLLADRKVEFSEMQYARYIGSQEAPRCIEALLSSLGSKLSADKFRENLVTGLKAHYTSAALTPAEGLRALLLRAVERKLNLVALSTIEEPEAKALIARLGWEGFEPEILAQPEPTEDYPTADVWGKALQAAGHEEAQGSVALVSSARALRGALGAGLRVIAVPDAFTAHEDFSGADCLVEGEADWSSKFLQRLVLGAGA